MSECVVRMELPGSCSSCRFRMSCLLYRKWLDGVPNVLPPQPLDDGCRIIAVLPENHGRLVDADALLRDIEQYHVSDGRFQHWLELQPTIVPAERSEQ